MSKYVGKIVTNQAPAGYSVTFDGTGDSLSIPYNAAFDFGTGDFTIEAWIYLTSPPVTNSNLYGSLTVGGTTVEWFNANQIALGNANVAWRFTSNSVTFPLRSWFHFAVTRASGVAYMWLNGVSIGSGAETNTFNAQSGTVYIGQSTGLFFPGGYISNFRVTKGGGLYTTAFTPPTQLFRTANTSLLTCNSPAIVDQSSNAFAITTNGNAAPNTFTPFAAYNPYNPALGASTPGVWTLDEAMQAAATRQWNMYDPSFQNTTLLLHGNGTNGAQNNTFLDSSSNNFTITRNGNTTQGSFSPFSQTGWSNFFDGSGDYISAPANAAFNFGTGDFTIEFWYYPNSISGARTLIEVNYGTAPNFIMQPSSGVMNFYTNGVSAFVASNVTDTIGSWYHYAAVRNGSTITLYRNGISVGTTTYSGNVGNSSAVCFVGGSLGGGGYYIDGYLSNVRVVKGTAVYTANFTPSSIPLTAITNTSLLTCQSNRFVDNSTNGFVISVAGNTSIQAFSPFSPTVAYTPQTIGGSGYFDGGGDYLTAPSGTATNLDGNFTIEGWVYRNTADPNFRFFTLGDSSLSSGIEMYVSGGNWTLYSQSTRITGASATKAAWTHIALVRSGSTVTLYINGSASGSTWSSSTTFSGIVYVAAENYSGGVTADSNGNICDFRIVKGTAVYTGNFTPPTAPLTAITNTSLLLNFTNAGIVDSTAKNVLETVGNAQISTAVSRFGGGSIAFDGTGDRLIAPASPNLDLSIGDFTIEGWFYSNTIAAGAASACARAVAGNITSGSDIQWNIYRSGSSLIVRPYQGTTDYSINLGTIAANIWYHVALTRSGNTFRGFLNGVQAGTTFTISGSLNNNTVWFGVIAGFLTVGADEAWNGYIEELRITKGFARYTANFTPQRSQWQDQ